METKHTPGPWIIGDWLNIYDATNVRIASVAGSGPTTRANARLIAEAPELLEALQELRYAATDKAEAMADAAIAKAVGHDG